MLISILGGSENGQWVVEKEAVTAELKMEDASEDSKGKGSVIILNLHLYKKSCMYTCVQVQRICTSMREKTTLSAVTKTRKALISF